MASGHQAESGHLLPCFLSILSLFLVTLGSIGGALPIVFAYFSEFLSREKRGEHLSWLGIFWMAGGIYAAAMAWTIIPHYGECQPWAPPADHQGPAAPSTTWSNPKTLLVTSALCVGSLACVKSPSMCRQVELQKGLPCG